ncbi:MAG: putative lipoprotein [Gemmatimonadetes bacterium]|jgi:uncharacterized protein (DUF305 family)|nr:putative lipoprotein [Gemmatimonadota bacterium]
MTLASRSTRTTLAAGLLAMALAAACGKGADTADGGAAAGATGSARAMPMDGGMAGHDMSAMSPATRNADHDFLRMMSDHHEGLLVMTGMAKDRAGSTASSDARRMETAQRTERDHMLMMLTQDFRDSTYAPRVMPRHRAMSDSLGARSAADFDRTFYENVIAHHREAITMIDVYLPKAKHAMLKSMAEKMKADQAKEIAEFERKARA